MRARAMRDHVSAFLKTRIVCKACSRCRCTIRCRQDEMSPRANKHTGIHARTHTHTHSSSRTHTHTHTHTHTRMHTHTQTHKHLHTLVRTGVLMVHLCYRHRFIKMSEQRMLCFRDGDKSSLVCRACAEFAPRKCRFCKCYLVGGERICDQCVIRLADANDVDVGASSIVPQQDSKWRGVCSICADRKRSGIFLYTQARTHAHTHSFILRL